MEEIPSNDRHAAWHPNEHPVLPDDILNKARAKRQKQNNKPTSELDAGYEELVRQNFLDSQESSFKTTPGINLNMDDYLPPTIVVDGSEIPPTIPQIGSEHIPDTIPQMNLTESAAGRETDALKLAEVSLEDLQTLSDQYKIDFLNRTLSEDDLKISNTPLIRAGILLKNLNEALQDMTWEEVVKLTEKYPNFNPERVDSIYKTNSRFLLNEFGKNPN